MYLLYIYNPKIHSHQQQRTLGYFFNQFSKKIRLDISCKLSAMQMICVKCHVLFSLKKKNEYHLLHLWMVKWFYFIKNDDHLVQLRMFCTCPTWHFALDINLNKPCLRECDMDLEKSRLSANPAFQIRLQETWPYKSCIIVRYTINICLKVFRKGVVTFVI